MKNVKCKMKNGFGAVCFASLLACCQSLAAFDVVALVDSLDFAKNYDIETATGTVQVLEHVLLTHANDIWWRDKGGGRMRYPSACEMWQVSEAPFDKKRLPSEDIYGYLRLESPRGNEFPVVREECRRRGLGFGVHTTIEENHWYSPLASNWTLAHPEYWGCTREGEPWMGCCSIMHPEVIAHKLEMVDERLALKPQKIMLDFWRNGAWTYAREYSAPPWPSGSVSMAMNRCRRRSIRAGRRWWARTLTTTCGSSRRSAVRREWSSLAVLWGSTTRTTRRCVAGSVGFRGGRSRRKGCSMRSM